MFKTAFATLFTLLMFMGSLSRLWSLRLRTTTSPNYSLERTAAIVRALSYGTHAAAAA